ncbi:MAG: DUF3575 domain-containing protein [Bacteroidales bacterium]|nr:DUF3575 domain-containing protein [Bacteroidales bacterium]
MKRILICLTGSLFFLLPLAAQNYSVGTNVADYAGFGTMNITASAALSRRWSIDAGLKYNPFLFRAGTPEPVSARQQLYRAGVRYWPWNVYSGWWMAGSLQYQEYNRGGIVSPETREGDRYGAGLSAGYSYMLHPHLNLDFGIGFWGGYDRYTVYACPVCGLTTDAGEKVFFLPNDMILALVYVF